MLAALNAMAFNPRAELRLRASAYAPAAGQGAFWLVGTLDDAPRRGPEWAGGGTADVAVRGGDGRVVLTKTVPITAADGGFAVQVPEGGGLPPGDYTIRVRAKSAAGATIDETARVTIAAEPPALGDAVVWRRRPATGPAYLRTADPRASRTDRLRFEFADHGGRRAVGHAARSRGQADGACRCRSARARRPACAGSSSRPRSRRSRPATTRWR